MNEVAEAILRGPWFTMMDVEQLAARTEEVTAITIAAIREHNLVSAHRHELGSTLHFAAFKLLLG